MRRVACAALLEIWKKENAERKAETENINKILNAENEKRMAEAQALKDKMEKEKKELQAYLEKVLHTIYP